MISPDQDTSIDHTLLLGVAIVFWALVLLALVRLLERSRPGLHIRRQVGVAYVARLAGVVFVGATGLGLSLRGGDEITFLGDAHYLSTAHFSSGLWLPFGQYGLHEILFALQIKLFAFTDMAMRVGSVALATIGVILIVAAVYDLGGARPARLTAWLLALEPATVFFSGLLHKDPLMMFAGGLVVFGGVKIWQRASPAGVLLAVCGTLVAIATRPYAGWFLGAATLLISLHAGMRNLGTRQARSMVVLIGVGLAIALTMPFAIRATSRGNLKSLQGSQTANASAAGTPGNNLALEKVNYSTRADLILHLPQRVLDLLVRPFPWQLSNVSQQLGAFGTLVAYALIVMTAWFASYLRGFAFDQTAPLVYTFLCLLAAYSLSVGNAGTGFRYRTHLVDLGIAVMVLLRERLRVQGPAVAPRHRGTLPVRELAPIS